MATSVCFIHVSLNSRISHHEYISRVDSCTVKLLKPTMYVHVHLYLFFRHRIRRMQLWLKCPSGETFVWKDFTFSQNYSIILSKVSFTANYTMPTRSVKSRHKTFKIKIHEWKPENQTMCVLSLTVLLCCNNFGFKVPIVYWNKDEILLGSMFWTPGVYSRIQKCLPKFLVCECYSYPQHL